MRSLLPLAWASALVLSGCRFDTGGLLGDPGDDAPDAAAPDGSGAPDAVPPDAMTFDAVIPDSMVDDDTDDDTVADAVDNCVLIPNLDQHDEDGDGDGDVCDNCPHLANAGQDDTTEVEAGIEADGVGDACDPRSGEPDVIALFHPFTGSALPAGWTVVAGTWAVSGDELHQTTTNNNQILHYVGLTATEMHVHTTVDLDNVPNSGVRSASLLTFYAPGTMFGTGYLCSLFDDMGDNNPGAQIATRYLNDGNIIGGDADSIAEQLGTGASFRLTGRADGVTPTCEVTTAATVLSSFGDITHQSGSVALRTNGVAATYRYVVVITPMN
jgi:hypothetical protein